MHKAKDRFLIPLAYLAIYLIWGSTYLAIRIGVREAPPFLFAGTRHLIAGLVMALLCAVKKQPFPRSRREYFDLSAAGLLLLCCANGLVSWAEQWVASSTASAMLATIPIVTAFLGAARTGSRPGRRGWFGLILGFVGVVMMIGPEAPAGGKQLFGLLAIALAAVFWSSGTVYIQRHPVAAPLFPRLAVQMLAAGVGLAVIGFLAEQPASFRPTAAGLGALAYLVVFGSFLAYTAFGYLLERQPAAKVATHAYINPVVGVILGALILAERISIWVVVALPAVLGGVLLVQTVRIRSR